MTGHPASVFVTFIPGQGCVNKMLWCLRPRSSAFFPSFLLTVWLRRLEPFFPPVFTGLFCLHFYTSPPPFPHSASALVSRTPLNKSSVAFTVNLEAWDMRERPNIVKRHPTAPAWMCECISVFLGGIRMSSQWTLTRDLRVNIGKRVYDLCHPRMSLGLSNITKSLMSWYFSAFGWYSWCVFALP